MNIFLTSYNTDKIECDFENGGCEETCINTVGSYYCHCDVPNTLAVDNRTCTGKGSKTYIGIKTKIVIVVTVVFSRQHVDCNLNIYDVQISMNVPKALHNAVRHV